MNLPKVNSTKMNYSNNNLLKTIRRPQCFKPGLEPLSRSRNRDRTGQARAKVHKEKELELGESPSIHIQNDQGRTVCKTLAQVKNFFFFNLQNVSK
jgi:hypothetical protein